MAQRLGNRLLDEAPFVDLVLGPDAYRALPDLIGGALGGHRAVDTAFKAWEHYQDVPQVRTDRVGAFVTVQRGCDYRCTFCVVPMTRGRERSRTLADIVNEVRRLAEDGVTEVTLLGQTVNSYHDGSHDFADLLRAVGGVAGLRRVRFTSPYPTDFTDRVVAAMAEVPAVCEHVHLPVQSGSSQVLKRMGRRYTRETYLEVVARLRGAIPGLALTTDIIVGFPGETDADFAETESLVDAVGFDDAYTFRYSPREGTGALRLPAQVPEDVAGERLERLIATVRAVARRRNAGMVGTAHEVLVEKLAKRGGLLQTRTRSNKVVLVPGPTEWIGRYLRVKLTGTTGSTFTGVPVQVGRELAILG
jgi:tRNA-2-methylthio-N6-dimethylallyladenosine synthase